MSEVTMCARPEGVTHVSCKTQKRPLSVIAEHDCDDLDVMNHNKHQQNRHQQVEDSGTKDNKSLSKDTPGSSNKDKADLAQSKVSKSKRMHKVSKGQKKTSTKASNFSPKNQPSTKKQHTSTSKSKTSHKNPTLTSPPPVSQFEVSSQLNTAHSLHSKCDQTITSTQQTDIIHSFCGKDNKCDTSLVQHTETTAPSKLKNSETERARHQPGSETKNLSLKETQNSSTISSDDVQANKLSLTPSEGSQVMTIVGEETERLISTLSPTPSPQSLEAESPTFGRPFLMQASGSLHEDNDFTQQHIPQITITLTEGTQRPSSPTFCSDLDTDDTTNNSSNISRDITNPTLTTDIGSSTSSKGGGSKLTTDIRGSDSFSQPLNNRTYFHSKRPKPGALPKTRCTESTGSAPEGELNQGGSCILENPEKAPLTYLSDFWKLKETTEKLCLSTRRPSTMLWKQQYIEGQGIQGVSSNLNGDVTEERLTTDRKKRINDTLGWLRNELQEMRSEDQNLARQLLTIRHEIHQLKLQRCTEEHQELIEDFQSELDDIQEFSDVLDFPQPVYGNNPLKHIGVTRLNISARRFSAC